MVASLVAKTLDAALDGPETVRLVGMGFEGVADDMRPIQLEPFASRNDPELGTVLRKLELFWNALHGVFGRQYGGKTQV